MGRAGRIEQVLRAALTPERLIVIDESHHHAGHAGASAAGETHFAVTVVAASFDGVNRVERQRHVNTLLAAEFGSGLHALSITARTPAEDKRQTGA